MSYQQDLGDIRNSFERAVQKLPESLEGLANLVTESFWKLVVIGDRGEIENAVQWANDEIGAMLTGVFMYHECGLEQEHEHWPELENLRLSLVGQATTSMRHIEAKAPFLEKLAQEGLKLRNPVVEILIRREFTAFAAEVSMARTALQQRNEDSAESVLENFPELKCLTRAEVDVLRRDAKDRERENTAARRNAAEIVGGRCGLNWSTVQRYAQPTSPKRPSKTKR